MKNILALDIGGAFIKATLLKGRRKPVKKTIPFELWKDPAKLISILASIKGLLKPEPGSGIVITMTGELCDCFNSRRQGVRHIVESAKGAFGPSIKVFGRKGILLNPRQAIINYREAASANWAAAPLYLTEKAGDFLLVDIGSTTTDLTPVRNGSLACGGWDDFTRLSKGELLYTGYLRTPVPAVVSSLRVRGIDTPVSSETFAVTADVHLIEDSITPSGYLCQTPDGKAKTKPAAGKRLARTVLAETGDLKLGEIELMAKGIADAQRDKIVEATRRFDLKVIAAGSGAFILNKGFRRGELKAHPLSKHAVTKGIDPSLALALMVKEGFFSWAVGPLLA